MQELRWQRLACISSFQQWMTHSMSAATIGMNHCYRVSPDYASAAASRSAVALAQMSVIFVIFGGGDLIETHQELTMKARFASQAGAHGLHGHLRVASACDVCSKQVPAIGG